MMGTEEIQKIIPHRYPILMVDRVLEVDEKAIAIVAQKNLSPDEPFFQGHFPGRPIMPGVLMVEAMAQAGLICLYYLRLVEPGTDFYFAGIDRAKFRRMVVPGEVLRMDVKFIKSRRNFWRLEGVATVEGQTAAEATMMGYTASPSKLQ